MANTWDFNKKFGCQILLHRGKSHESGAESHYFVKGLSFDLFTKYRWYFRYRAALLQVQYPMRYVELRQFDYEHKPEKAELRKRLKDKIKGNKAKLTQWKNVVADYEKKWHSLFPISSDIRYTNTLQKIAELENKILSLEGELLNFDKNESE